MAQRVERKLAAILAADVVGYSRLMGEDEAGTHARLRTHRKEFIEPVIADHRGRVVKLTGDGALVEFASAVDAVECAAAIQGGLARQAPTQRRLPIPAQDPMLFDPTPLAARAPAGGRYARAPPQN